MHQGLTRGQRCCPLVLLLLLLLIEPSVSPLHALCDGVNELVGMEDGVGPRGH